MRIDPNTHKHALAFIITVVLLDAIGFGIILPVTPKLIIELEKNDGTFDDVRLRWSNSGYSQDQSREHR